MEKNIVPSHHQATDEAHGHHDDARGLTPARLKDRDPLGKWMSAALDDPSVCAEMRADILAWFEAGKPAPLLAAHVGGSAGSEVDFYEREFYPLSNFSSFSVQAHGWRFQTSEHLYHWLKFEPQHGILRADIRDAPSAHDAFKLAERNREKRRADWDDVKVDAMRAIIRAKADQHEYVRRKLLETGDRPLVEGSWRDDFWGIGPNRDGQNMLGKLWMELRAELRAKGQP